MSPFLEKTAFFLRSLPVASNRLLPLGLGGRRARGARSRELGRSLFDSQPRPAGADLVEAAAVLGVELRVAALGAERLAVDEEGQHGRRRLEEVAGRDDQVGALAGLDRADLVGDAQDLRRRRA